jgi:hypothetical protein
MNVDEFLTTFNLETINQITQQIETSKSFIKNFTSKKGLLEFYCNWKYKLCNESFLSTKKS